MKQVLLVLTLISIFSCSKQEKISYLSWKDQYTLKKVGDLIFDIDQQTGRYFNPISYSQSMGSLCLFNNNNHTLYFYNIENGELQRKIQYEKQGPNSVPTVHELVAYSEDSIISLNRDFYSITIFNIKGEVIFKKRILDDSDPGLPLRHQFNYHNGKIYTPVKGYAKTSKNLKQKAALIYDLNTSKKVFVIDSPSEFEMGWADRDPMRDAVFLKNRNEFVITWSMSKAFESINLTSGQSKNISYDSKRLKKTKKYDGSLNDRLSKDHYLLSNSWIESLHMDKSKGFLLRSATVGKLIPKGESLNKQYKSLNKDSIFVLTEIFDETLQKVGEVPNVSFYNDVFSTENFIYVSNYMHDIGNEDIIAFSKYQLVKKNGL